MIITLVTDTFDVGNNGITVSAKRFAANLIDRGHTVRVVACGEPGDARPDQQGGPEVFWVPELVVPIATRLAHRQNTAFGKPDRETLIAAIKDADVVHVYQPWPLGRAAEECCDFELHHQVAAFVTIHNWAARSEATLWLEGLSGSLGRYPS